MTCASSVRLRPFADVHVRRTSALKTREADVQLHPTPRMSGAPGTRTSECVRPMRFDPLSHDQVERLAIVSNALGRCRAFHAKTIFATFYREALSNSLRSHRYRMSGSSRSPILPHQFFVRRAHAHCRIPNAHLPAEQLGGIGLQRLREGHVFRPKCTWLNTFASASSVTGRAHSIDRLAFVMSDPGSPARLRELRRLELETK